MMRSRLPLGFSLASFQFGGNGFPDELGATVFANDGINLFDGVGGQSDEYWFHVQSGSAQLILQ